MIITNHSSDIKEEQRGYRSPGTASCIDNAMRYHRKTPRSISNASRISDLPVPVSAESIRREKASTPRTRREAKRRADERSAMGGEGGWKGQEMELSVRENGAGALHLTANCEF